MNFNNSIKKRQHFVPQSFLKGFSDLSQDTDKIIWEYKKGENSKPKCKSIKSINWKEYYYEGDIINNDLENILSEWENESCQIIRGMVPIVGSKVEINNPEKARLAHFIALLLTRNPSFRDPARNFMQSLANKAYHIANSLDKKCKSKALRSLEEDGVPIEVRDPATLEIMITSADQIARSLIRKSWQFYVPPENEFLITSDNPVFFGNCGTGLRVGPAHPLSEVVLNLRKDLALVITPKEMDRHTFQMTRQKMIAFNKGTVMSGGKYVYASKSCGLLSAMISKVTKQGPILHVP